MSDESTEPASFEIEHGHAAYSDVELLEQARANAQALVIASAIFLQERGIEFDEWTATIGRVFGRAWGEPRLWDAGEFLDAMLTNFRSLGAAVNTVQLGTDRANAVVTDFPDPDLCAIFGIAVEDVAHFNEVPAAIARERGLRWSWRRDDAQTRYVVERVNPEP